MIKYTSPNTGQEVTEPNYIVELISINKAKKDNNGVLPKKYWNLPKYQKFYKLQLIAANRLLKKFDAVPIINFIKNSPWIWSLAPKWVADKVVKFQKDYERELEARQETEIAQLTERRKPSKEKNNLFGTL